MQDYDVIVIGAGAAGMMCAAEVGRRGRRIAVLDHAAKIGAKILISGGGRCNFTNLQVRPEDFVSNNPHFCKSALARYTPADFIDKVRKHKIPFHEKKLGQLFCDRSAQDIVDLLTAECRQAGVIFLLSTHIQSVQKTGDGFVVTTSQGPLRAASLVVATGGLSLPKTGATGFGYLLAQQFGLSVVPTAAALDGFLFDAGWQKKWRELAGVSLDVRVCCHGAVFRENILFTHVGISGPAALQASLYWMPGEKLVIDLLPEIKALDWLLAKKRQGSTATIQNGLAEFFPKRFASAFCDGYFPDASRFADVPDAALKKLAGQLHRWECVPTGTVGYSKAEVTRGGVDTDELSSQTMESKKVPGLYFIGEVVDVTGKLGGYNFQWAWSSGWVAGQSL